jgi:hypothetical protein
MQRRWNLRQLKLEKRQQPMLPYQAVDVDRRMLHVQHDTLLTL